MRRLCNILAADDGKEAQALMRGMVARAKDSDKILAMLLDRVEGPVATKVESDALEDLVKRELHVHGEAAMGKRAAMPGEEGDEPE